MGLGKKKITSESDSSFQKKDTAVCVASGGDKGLYCFDKQHDY